MGLFTNPLGHAGYPPGVTGTPTTQPASIRAATAAEAAAGVLDNCYISPATAQSATALDFASPPVLGFGSTTPRPVHATTLDSTGLTSIATGAGAVANIGNATGTIGFYGATAVAKPGSTTDLRTALINLGLYTTGGASPLNLNGGALTAGTVAAASTVTAGTTLTATLGNITATNGNIVKGTAGNKDVYTSVASTTTAGANSAGTVTLVGGTATIATTAVTASSIIRLYRQGIGATGAAALGILTRGTISAGVSFVINSVQAADATALQASDVSSIGWEIVN